MWLTCRTMNFTAVAQTEKVVIKLPFAEPICGVSIFKMSSKLLISVHYNVEENTYIHIFISLSSKPVICSLQRWIIELPVHLCYGVQPNPGTLTM